MLNVNQKGNVMQTHNFKVGDKVRFKVGAIQRGFKAVHPDLLLENLTVSAIGEGRVGILEHSHFGNFHEGNWWYSDRFELMPTSTPSKTKKQLYEET